MRELRKKLHSQSGASILLALLFLLACMMVGASVLTAAASNAGKIQSSYEEQQRYLALSSALRLVIDQLERAEYQGRYKINQWTEVEEITVTNENGEPVTIKIDHEYYNVQQERGAFSCGSLAVLEEIKDPATGKSQGKKTKDGALLSFQKEMDGVFAKEFTATGYFELKSSKENPTRAPLPTEKPQVLTVKVLDETAKDKFRPVEVKISMGVNRRIHLKALMNTGATADSGNYIMEAELAPSANMPAIQDYPMDQTPKEDIAIDRLKPSTVVETEYKMTGADSAAGWKLDWISREVKEEKKGAGG